MPWRHDQGMNYRRIEYFLAVVDAGTVTAAADIMQLAQPALSRQLRTLEAELNLSLFSTKGNRLVLTNAGRAFVPAARRLMLETQGLADTAESLRTGRVTRLEVAATAASVRGFLAPFIASTSSADPLITTRETSHFAMRDALLHGADFMISPAVPEPGLQSTHLGSIPLTAYVAAGHPWAVQEVAELPLEALRRAHIIVPSHQSASRYILDNALNQSRLTPGKITECDDGQTIMALTAAGHGIGVTTERPLYGVHPVRLLDTRAGGPLAPAVLQLPLHAAWVPTHFAADTIASIAARLRLFLDRQGNTLPQARDQSGPYLPPLPAPQSPLTMPKWHTAGP